MVGLSTSIIISLPYHDGVCMCVVDGWGEGGRILGSYRDAFITTIHAEASMLITTHMLSTLTHHDQGK